MDTFENSVKRAAAALRSDEDFMEYVHASKADAWSDHVARVVLRAAYGRDGE